ncbi:MAG: SDR family oxidoreductase [Caldilineaceae bacterium]
MARKKLQGQVAIITGGGRGIGAAAAERLCSAGAAVVITARSEEQIEQVAAALRTRGGKAIAVVADVSDREQVEEVVESALDQFGRVDILINNAATIWPIEMIADSDPDEWAYNIFVNLVGAFHAIHNVLPLMQEQGYGRILNISSGAAIRPVLGWSAYNASKAGLEALTRSLALELHSSPIAINALRPGDVDTEMQADIRSIDTSETTLDFSRFHTKHAQGTLFRPEQVADAIYWLVGPWSRTVSGEIFEFKDEAWRAKIEQDVKT